MKFVNYDGRCYYTLDELSYGDFDKTGRMNLWRLGKLFEGSRRQRGQYGPEHRLLNQRLIFVRSQTYEIRRGFYSKLNQNRSVKIISYLTHLGKTSYCVDEELRDLMTDELFARTSYHAVGISRETRRPTPFPAEVVKTERVFQPWEGKRPLPDPEFPRRPSKCFMHHRTVMPSDTDRNEHLNQAGYLQFSLDCVSLAAVKGTLSTYHRDIAYYDAKRLWIRYISEAKAGDEVTIYCWEDENLCQIIWVELTKESKVIGHCQLEFHEQNEIEGKRSLPLAKL